jgi:hypothetical protein
MFQVLVDGIGMALAITGAALVFRNVTVGGREPVMGRTESGTPVTQDQFRHARLRLLVGLLLGVLSSVLMFAADHVHL